MAVRIRMRRTGTKSRPCFRVVVADARAQRDGRFIEQVGFYNPVSKEERIDLERVEYWISRGAQPSRTVRDLTERIRSGKKRVKTEPEKKKPAAAEKSGKVEEKVEAAEKIEDIAKVEKPVEDIKESEGKKEKETETKKTEKVKKTEKPNETTEGKKLKKQKTKS